MKSEKLYEILEGINEDYINESEEYTKKRTLKSIFKTNRLALVAAVLALLLCGTAAAAGLMWLIPEIQEEENGFSIVYDGRYVELPNETVQTILNTWEIAGESSECRLYIFKTVKEWQSFFGIPFVARDYIDTDKDSSQELINHPNGTLCITGDTTHGDIATAVLFKETNGELKPYIMQTFFGASWSYYVDGIVTRVPWYGEITARVPLSKEAAKEFKIIRNTNQKQSHELLEEGKTPSGIPYVITKTVFNLAEYPSRAPRDPNEYQAAIHLYYGYDSVLFDLDGRIDFPEDEGEMVHMLKEIVSTFKVHYPAE